MNSIDTTAFDTSKSWPVLEFGQWISCPNSPISNRLRTTASWDCGRPIGLTGTSALGWTSGPFLALGLTASASREEVKARHRELALRHHPDRGGDAGEFRRVQAAYEAALVILDERAA